MDSQENFRQFTELLLGISAMDIDLHTREETRHATQLMTHQCGHTVEIFSRDLDAPLYDQKGFLQALGALCLRNRKARIRILVQEPKAAIQGAHRLIELARRLSSSIELRQPHSDYRAHNEAFLIADHCGLIQRPLADRYAGSANFYHPIDAGRKLEFFTEVWERSEAHPEFRRLYL